MHSGGVASKILRVRSTDREGGMCGRDSPIPPRGGGSEKCLYIFGQNPTFWFDYVKTLRKCAPVTDYWGQR